MPEPLIPWSLQQEGLGGTSSRGPTLAAFRGRLFAAWKGVAGDDRMFWSSFDGLNWSGQSVGIGGGSSTGPTLAVFQDRLFAAWKGAGADERMFWSSFDGQAWAPQQVGIGGGSSESPAIATYRGLLFAAWKGAGADERMFWSSFDGQAWAPQQVGIGGGSSTGPTLAVFQDRLFATWKGAGADERMFWSSFDGQAWAPQQVGIGGGSSTGPMLAVYRLGLDPQDDRLFAAWKGSGEDQRMFWSMFDGAAWSEQQPGIGGGTNHRPSLAAFDDNLFAAWKGVAGDERMFWSTLGINRTPLKPLIVSPAQGAQNQPLRPQFQWQDPGAGTVRAAKEYLVEVTSSDHPNFDQFFAGARDVTAITSFQPQADLPFGVSCIWRVTAANGPVGRQRVSEPAKGTFKVVDRPAPPPPQPPTIRLERLTPDGFSASSAIARFSGTGFPAVQGQPEVVEIFVDEESVTTTEANVLGNYGVDVGVRAGAPPIKHTAFARGQKSGKKTEIISFSAGV